MNFLKYLQNKMKQNVQKRADNIQFLFKFSGFDDIERLKVLDFDKLNSSGLFVSLIDPKNSKDYKNCLELISTYFHYPQFHNGLILNYLLFNIDDWDTNLLSSFDERARHYLMRLRPNWKKILHNSGKQIRIPEGMQFNSLVSLKSQSVGHWRKITKPLFSRCIYYISSTFSHHKSKNFFS